MRTIPPFVFQNTRHLPNHQRLLKAALDFFSADPGVDGAFLKGSLAAGRLGPFEPLNLGLFCQAPNQRENSLAQHSKWKIATGLRLIKSDSKDPFAITFVSDPALHLSLKFYTLHDLPSPEEGPFLLAWDSSGHLASWLQKAQKLQAGKTEWAEVTCEDEQFWVWTHFSASHAAQGEYHDVVVHLEDLREIVQKWQHRIDAMARKDAQKFGNRFRHEFLERLTKTFCPPHGESIKEAYKNLIKIQLQQRALISKAFKPSWKVSAETICKIQHQSLNW